MSAESSRTKKLLGSNTVGEASDSLTESGGRIRLSYFNLFWIFVIACVAGLLVETLVSTPIDGILKNRAGLVWGPFSPIYGIGGVLMTIALNHVKGKNLLHIFLVSALVGASFEFVTGWLLENLFGIIAWSYYDEPFNLLGYTSLKMAVVWGLAGLFWIKFALSWVMKLIHAIPRRIATPLTVVMSVFMFVNIIMTLLSFDCWFNRQAGLPIANPIQEFFAQYYGDDFMNNRFQTMSIYSELTLR